MSQFANKTQLGFDPLPESFSVNSIAAGVYETPLECRETLSDLARLAFLRASMSGALELSAVGTCTATVSVTDGATVYGSVVVAIVAAQRANFSLVDVPLADF